MNMKKYRVVQTEELKYEVQEYVYVDCDVRTGESIYNWKKINEYIGDYGLDLAKKEVNELVCSSKYPKVVYEKEVK